MQRRNPLSSSLILGLIWGIWHFPLFFTEGLPQAELVIPLFLLASLAISIIATWLFIYTRGNVLISFLFHFSINFTLALIGMEFLHFALLVSIAAAPLAFIMGNGRSLNENIFDSIRLTDYEHLNV